MSGAGADADYCAAHCRAHDYDRYLCALFAPAAARRAIFAVLAFNVELAQVATKVSEPILGEIRLQWWRDALAAIDGGTPPAHAVVRELARADVGHGLAPADLDALIDVRSRALGEQAPARLSELVAFGAESDGRVARLILQVLGADDEPARLAARHAGTAWYLTGILGTDTAIDTDELVASAREHLAGARRQKCERAALPALLPAALADLYLNRLSVSGGSRLVSPLRRLVRVFTSYVCGKY